MQPVAIAFTVSGARPGYLDESLASWQRVRGFKRAKLIFCVEPGDGSSEEVIDARLKGHPVIGTISHTEPHGVSANTRSALQMGLVLADYVILAEEDLLVSDDVLEYHDWARQQYEADDQVSGVCSFTRWSDDPPDQAIKAPFFNPLVWGTWQSRANLILSSWAGPMGDANDAWDRRLLSGLVAGLGKRFIFPSRSRVQHFGRYGVHGTGDNPGFQETVSQCFQPRYGRQKYREVPLEDFEVTF